ncbi:hypothetical protein SKTS_32690 [Sulfurimicrobium lacus]|uniref:Uncharacterized protein n=1 Tax=Sulfurimicrobium lacus TaxID=2715678 RepID=A0A6F8VEZ0_9PROT|nr:hypothetical protein SKTS_32690 [Sulfurimicrobium lacus]
MHADKAAGKRKGIQCRVFDYKKLETAGRVLTVRDQSRTQGIKVIGNLGIVQQLAAAANIAHDGFADATFLLRREDGLRSIAQVGQAIGKNPGQKNPEGQQ